MDQYTAILDVGHGSSAVVRIGDYVLVIDSGPGSALLEFLSEQSIDRIDLLLVSHADADHMGGLAQLLATRAVSIARVIVNSDALKDTAMWDDVTYELDLCPDTVFETALTPSTSLDVPETVGLGLEVLGPSSYLAAKSPGSTDRQGRRITSNSISAVIRLSLLGQPLVLLTGDMDFVGLADTVRHRLDLTAPILVFPHHGGLPHGAPVGTFTQDLVSRVKPETVIISLGRGQHNTPRPAILAALRALHPTPCVMCTQLSDRCAAALPSVAPTHLGPFFARGREQRRCCAGTVVLALDGSGALTPDAAAHAAFVDAHADTALCRR